MKAEDAGLVIKVLRVEKGMSRNKLAEIAGVSHPTIVQVEAGNRRLSLDTAVRIFDALGYDLTFMRKEREE